jgi:hypothetical protein
MRYGNPIPLPLTKGKGESFHRKDKKRGEAPLKHPVFVNGSAVVAVFY